MCDAFGSLVSDASVSEVSARDVTESDASAVQAALSYARGVLDARPEAGCVAVCVGCCASGGVTPAGSAVLCGSGRGVRPLLAWLAQGVRLDGYAAVDRVVGRGAALLYAKLGVEAVHALTMSEAGVAALRAHGVLASYDRLVPVILNRAGDGMCPIECAVTSVDEASDASLPVDLDVDLDEAESVIRAAVAHLMASRPSD